MLGIDQIDRLSDREVYGSDGEKIGAVRQIFTDDATGTPAWMTVRTGLFGMKETFVPLDDADLAGDRITVPYTKEFVKDAPNVDDNDGHLAPDQERELYAYYDRTADYDSYAGSGQGLAAQGSVGERGTTGYGTKGYDTSGPSTDEAMTVSEERLDVGTERRETGRARLRKYVVTEQVTQTVPVQREEVRLEREPITEANRGAAMSGPAISEEEHEVVLHEERPVVAKETVPVERVRLDTETVTDQQTVTDEVRKERVEVEGDDVRR
jgi:uncharacterized protein (TIGR02271 family)